MKINKVVEANSSGLHKKDDNDKLTQSDLDYNQKRRRSRATEIVADSKLINEASEQVGRDHLALAQALLSPRFKIPGQTPAADPKDRVEARRSSYRLDLS